MRGLTLTAKEQTRLQILNGVLERHWSMREAAEVLGVSERQGWRLLAAYRKEGAAALAHGNRGRVPPNATPAATRQRMPQEGMLVQIGGSHHRWLEERGSWFTLLLAVDDATGTVPYALFQEQENTEGYFRLMTGIIQQRGIPLALYSDRHAVFQHQGRTVSEGSPGIGASEPTQFGRALRDLGGDPGICPQP